MPMPPSSPAAEAVTRDDGRLDEGEPMTWRREAPSARSRAFSRVRWATTIAKVLWMEKVATSSAMPEKTSSKVVKRVRNWPEIMSVFSSVDSWPVIASTPLGSTGVSAVDELLLAGAGAGAHLDGRGLAGLGR